MNVAKRRYINVKNKSKQKRKKRRKVQNFHVNLDAED